MAAFDASKCKFTVSDLNLANNGLTRRDPKNPLKCMCGQLVRAHPSRPRSTKGEKASSSSGPRKDSIATYEDKENIPNGRDPKEVKTTSAPQLRNINAELELVMRSSLVVRASVNFLSRNFDNAVAVSKKKAIVAVHGMINEGCKVEVFTRSGVALSGKIGFMRYSRGVVDIAVIQLDEDQEFQHYVPYTTSSLRRNQDIVVVGLNADLFGSGYSTLALTRRVKKIPSATTFFEVDYYSLAGMSGHTVMTVIKDGRLRVVGVHVAASNGERSFEEEYRPYRTRSAVTGGATGSGGDDITTEEEVVSDGSTGGGKAYCLGCALGWVKGLVEYLSS